MYTYIHLRRWHACRYLTAKYQRTEFLVHVLDSVPDNVVPSLEDFKLQFTDDLRYELWIRIREERDGRHQRPTVVVYHILQTEMETRHIQGMFSTECRRNAVLMESGNQIRSQLQHKNEGSLDSVLP